MTGYKDRTWCGSTNCQNKCGRKLTEEDRQKAIKWWGNEYFPISVARFCDNNGDVI